MRRSQQHPQQHQSRAAKPPQSEASDGSAPPIAAEQQCEGYPACSTSAPPLHPLPASTTWATLQSLLAASKPQVAQKVCWATSRRRKCRFGQPAAPEQTAVVHKAPS